MDQNVRATRSHLYNALRMAFGAAAVATLTVIQLQNLQWWWIALGATLAAFCAWRSIYYVKKAVA